MKREWKQHPRFANPLKHLRNHHLGVKPTPIKRFFEQSENIKYTSEDIGYSKTSIYQWRKYFLREGILDLMNHKNIPPQKLDQNITQVKTDVSSSHEMEELKKQMLEMQT